MDIADYLADKLRRYGLSQSEFGRQTGISSSPVCKWLSRSGTPDLESCLKIAAFFREDPGYIFQLAGRADYARLWRQFQGSSPPAPSLEQLFPAESHRKLHLGLQRLLEQGMRSREDVQVGVQLLQRSLQELVRSENLFRTLLEESDLIPWEAEPETWRFTYVGPQAERVFGYPLEEWYRPTFWDEHIHPEDRHWAVTFSRQFHQEPSRRELEYRMLRADGATVWVHQTVLLRRLDWEEEKRVRGFLLDVTPFKERELQLEEQRRHYREVFLRSPLPMALLDREGSLLECNRGLRRLLRLPEEPPSGQRLEELLETFSPPLPQALEEIFRHPEHVFQGELVCDGSPMGVSLSLLPEHRPPAALLVLYPEAHRQLPDPS